jgi:hypothetical protein
MSNINVVQFCWNFAQLKEIKKEANSQNLKSLALKTKNRCNYWGYRRFGQYVQMPNFSNSFEKRSNEIRSNEIRIRQELPVLILICNFLKVTKSSDHFSKTLEMF